MTDVESTFVETRLAGLWKALQPNHLDLRGETTEILNFNWLPSLFPEFTLNQIIAARSFQGTIRGIHFSATNNPQSKVISCTEGEIRDCIIDLRPGSSTFCEYEIFDLSAERREVLLVSSGFGHAYQVISDSATVLYALQTRLNFSQEYVINPLDDQISIPWENLTPILSERDKSAPNLREVIRDHFS